MKSSSVSEWVNKICPKCISLTMVQNPRQVNFCERCGTKLEVSPVESVSHTKAVDGVDWKKEARNSWGYKQGVKEERQRIVEMIKELMWNHTQARGFRVDKRYNQALSDLQSKLKETI